MILISGKNLPVHCVVETIHNIVETQVSSRENWRRPQVETDSYVIIPVAMPFQVSNFFLYYMFFFINNNIIIITINYIEMSSNILIL